ncbi:MmgE/PrpD family protein [Methylobacterium sp. 17Sr1-1]|uniref:MmgE/PrpD family protein n=1 Tax=Methylobacterium sp. 17Sr1-1 TaxID=2202826 RepID=UPI000D6F00FA|nr:MmgE/PrpD family protein [Methylobacterium sp. 17Sr1-1]AWN54106.1 MmgE/PrpD family protein [Methylobacterium sp. 17Sr1-1]
MTTSLTHRFAAAIVASAPSDAAVDAARLAILDLLACTLGGADDRSTGILAGTLGANTGPSVLIGRTERADPFTAALINGHAGHVLDYDDVHASVRGHPTVVILPALLALAGTRPVAARDLIGSYIVGLEAMARLGLALGSRHYETGFHATATLGTVGAAAAVAHLLRFSPETTVVALGLAATQSAGLRLQFGYDAKPLHAGLGARAGLTAALLAESGLSGAPDFLGGPIGFLDAFGFGATVPERLLAGWGAPWQILTPGLTLKAFPCCTAAHPVAVGALALRDADGLRPEAVEAVTLTFPPGGDAALVVSRPGTGIEARFSPEYIFAAALTDGALGIGHFDERPVRPDLAGLAARVSRRHDDTAPRLSSDPATRFVVLDVTLTDGRTVSRRIEGLPGLSDAGPKFRDATGDAESFAEIPDLVARMSDADDLARLLALLGQSRS